MKNLLSDHGLVKERGNYFTCDVECYKNYFLICFESLETGGRVFFEGTEFNKKKLRWVLNNCTIVTFNGNSYDLPIMLTVLQTDYNEKQLWDCTQQLIVENMFPWSYYKAHGMDDRRCGHINHIDLIQVAFGKASLKLYAGRLGAPFLQDLPYPPEMTLTIKQQEEVLKYCFNDLNNTKVLFNDLKKPLQLREDMSIRYGMDLRSKSDAQIAEAVIGSSIKSKTGIRPKKRKVEPFTFKYNVPDFIKFRSKTLNDVLDLVKESDFLSDETGVHVPKEISGCKFKIHESIYKIGIGGLHSTEESITHTSNDSVVYKEKDVSSYYPTIILNQNLFPKHLGESFITIYREVLQQRLDAKSKVSSLKEKIKKLKLKLDNLPEIEKLELAIQSHESISASLKISANGSFGKFGSVYSILYAPELLIQVTVTGQLALLMLIERLEIADFRVVSANTDGLVTRIPREREDEYQKICAQWEADTNFDLDETEYSKLLSRDVNNYIAIKDGDVKVKGCFKPSDISKNPSANIVYKAVVDHFVDGTPVEETIKECIDPAQFVSVRTVKGGALKDGELIGKVIRWYYGKREFGCMKYKLSGNRVPKSDGAVPLMHMNDELPLDLDHDWYIREANKIIRNDFSKPEQFDLFQ